jgi:hypothetical protein
VPVVLRSFILQMKNEDLIHSYTRLLQHGKGSIAKALSGLNRALLRGSWCDVADEHDACELAKTTFCSRMRAQTLIAAHGQTSWPGSYGQSPYAEVFGVVRHVLAGHMLPRTASKTERSLHRALFEQLAPPAAISRFKLDEAGRTKRYKRLLFGMREAAILSRTEADAVLRQLLGAHPADRASLIPCSEAVAHFGGTKRVLTMSINRRAYYRDFRALSA